MSYYKPFPAQGLYTSKGLRKKTDKGISKTDDVRFYCSNHLQTCVFSGFRTCKNIGVME